MQWQDMVLAGGSFIFTLALVPSIRGKDKPAFASSVTTAAILGVFAVTYATLSLYLSVFSTCLTGLAWVILAVQKHRQADS